MKTSKFILLFMLLRMQGDCTGLIGNKKSEKYSIIGD